MLNKIIELGDANGEGHSVKVTAYDNGAVVFNSYNHDSDITQQVVLLPDQWRAAMKIMLEGYGNEACPNFRQPNICGSASPTSHEACCC
jgi:hypothetical protein